MSKTPIFDETLMDHPEVWGTTLTLARPVLPTHTAKDWAPAKAIKTESTLRTFSHCLWWWKP